MNTPERQSIKVEGVVAHHKARIPNPAGLPDVYGEEEPTVTMQVKPNRSFEQPYARVAPHVFTAHGENAQEIFSKLLMQDLLHTGTPVVITYDQSQPVPKGGEGWVMDSISVPHNNGEEHILLDLRAKTKGSID